jgi:uncharacterized protein YjbI with pentapeptide repeats
MDVRLGGIYSLERLARDSPADYDVVFEVLSAYVRTHAGAAPECTQRVHVDIQAVLSVIQRREVITPDPRRFNELDLRQQILIARRVIDLSGACLHSADLVSAPLENAVLKDANLSYALLMAANLSFASLYRADLDGADLDSADLSDVNMESASLADAYLVNVDLSGADLSNADLSGADVTAADLSGADLTGTVLSGIRYDDSTVWPDGFTPPPSRP